MIKSYPIEFNDYMITAIPGNWNASFYDVVVSDAKYIDATVANVMIMYPQHTIKVRGRGKFYYEIATIEQPQAPLV